MSPAVRTSAKGQRSKTAKRGVPGAKKIVNDLLPGFSRQLAAMLSAGMPIVATLEALEEQSDNPNFRTVVTRLKASIENGAAFSDALRQFPSIFDDLYANMVRGGESGGQLAETIARLAGFLEASAKLRRKVKSAMMYPTIILCIAISIAIAMIVFIVPVFGEMFADFGAELPAPTQFLLNLSDGLKQYGGYIIVAIVVAVIAFKRWKATPAGGYQLDQVLLKAPVFGDLRKKVASARFARTFGQLIKSGVPILSSLEIVSGATGSVVAQKIILDASKAVENGDPLSSAMINQNVFPILLVRMLQAGEKTGKIDEMMDNIADFYDDEVDTMLAGLTSLLEPLLMVFLGVVIGGIVLCMFLPIFKMGEVVSG
ncbi:MAG: type II secretion system F family protein [Verrucomicrobia bacterium]|jgi:type IV pilus assembly protein PilC|nr:type II secretion system F family protein [Verrucomicrobiota bacterium]